MQFKYRYVAYGTSFVAASGQRKAVDAPPDKLYENELVVDVGGVCWGVGGEQRSVIDHHFHRSENQFPSASAAVLHNATRIWSRFAGRGGDGDTFWFVTHREPDFDAYCAMYLAREILLSGIPFDGWEAFGLDAEGWPSNATKRG